MRYQIKNTHTIKDGIRETTLSAALIIYSADGKIRYRQELDCEKHYNVLNTKDWSAGLYFYNLIDQQQLSRFGKFIISK